MSLLHIAGGAAEDKLDVSDVFSAYVRNGTGADVTVTTGIDYTKGFMTWTKGRSGATDHAIYDSARGVTKDLASNTTAAQTTQTTGLKAVSTTGHTIGSLAKMNTSGATYVDWVFKKAPKFFDIVTYTGNGVAGRQIPHNLGVAPGMVIVKVTSLAGDNWFVYHRGLDAVNPSHYTINLNLTDARTDTANAWYDTEPTSSVFTVGSGASWINQSGATYIAYLFAHDPSADGIIQCGSYTGNGSTNGPTITLGFEPQFLLIKNASSVQNWNMVDAMRGMSTQGYALLQPNISNAEGSTSGGYAIVPTATGFKINTDNVSVNENSSTMIYMAIRRPNKVPTSGSEVFSSNFGTNTTGSLITTNFPIDFQIGSQRTSFTDNRYIATRLLGVSTTSTEKYNRLITSSTAAENTSSGTRITRNWSNIGFEQPSDITNLTSPIYYSFKRAKGFFDVVCYTGTGVARTVNHNLGVVPELMIVKSRSGTGNWSTYCKYLTSITYRLNLNSTSQETNSFPDIWASTLPTEYVFSLGAEYAVNDPSTTYIAYLFATLPGISKVGSYTGNGTSQTIPCGFSTGARFILIKRTDSTGDWYVWDAARGIVAANDPHLSLNTTAAEVTTDDSVDPESSGFIVNQVAATNINVNLATYIYFSVS